MELYITPQGERHLNALDHAYEEYLSVPHKVDFIILAKLSNEGPLDIEELTNQDTGSSVTNKVMPELYRDSIRRLFEQGLIGSEDE